MSFFLRARIIGVECQALALIKQEELKLGAVSPRTLETGLAQLEASLGVLRTMAVAVPCHDATDRPLRHASGARVLCPIEGGFPVTAYPTLLLRGSAKAVQCVPLPPPLQISGTVGFVSVSPQMA